MVNISQTNKAIIKQESQPTDADVWPIPNVTAPKDEQDEKTNAMGKKSTWRFEPPEEESVEEPVPLTADEIESIRQAAYEEGFNQGKEDGYSQGYDEGKQQGHEQGLIDGNEIGKAQGLEAGQEEIAELSKQWQQLITELHQPLQVLEKNIEEQILHLTVKLAEAVTLQEAKTNPDVLLSAIGIGLKALPANEPNIQILLHPDDIKITEEQFGEDYIQEQGWSILAAPQLERGSCQIENSTSNIDLSIKTRLKDVLDSFLQEALHQ